ncbi:MAG: hypothetical protein LC792_01360 [Actinobacteria bacterium]|nr:hypothetical protein [Actinomycetota bacterium]
MAETMSHVERVLWRIAELGARCSQQAASGARGPLWEELENTIAGLETEFEAARQAVDIAPAQVRTLEGRLKVARQERDRERAKVQESFADAESARRERDRERARAGKAVAAAVAARNEAAQAKTTATECISKAAAAEAAADQAMAARDQAMSALDEAITAGEAAVAARDQAVQALDETIQMLDESSEALADAKARIAELETALEAARAEQEHAVDALAARAEGAVVVLPGVALPEAPAPAQPAKVSWQPTWSEWASEDDDVPAPAVEASATDMADAADDPADELVLDDTEEGGVRYLNVAATIAQLLPEDLGPMLLAGATVVRREGRLFATLAVTTNPWAEPDADTAQADRLAEAGFKVEWTTHAPLGV